MGRWGGGEVGRWGGEVGKERRGENERRSEERDTYTQQSVKSW